MNWQNIELGEMLTLQRGYDLPSQSRLPGNVPIVSSSGITSFHNKAKEASPGVVTGRYGTIGEVFYLSEAYWPLNTTLFVKDFKGNNPKFISYLLECLNLKEMNSAGAVPGVNRNHLHKLKIKAPTSRLYQDKLVSLVSAYDDLIENNLKRIKLLEEMAQITYEEWFVQMKFPGHESAVIDTETDLPDGWNKGIVTDLCKVNSESITSKSAPQLIKYIDISSANTGGYEAPERLHFVDAPSRARRKVNRGDTIFSTVRPNRQIYSLIMHSDPELVASTGFAVLTPHEVTHFSFVYLSVAEQGFVDRVVSVASGAAYPAVNQRDFEKISVIIPDQAVLDLFSNQVNHCFESIALLKQQNELLREARDILLPRLMTGMIDIDQVEVPEVLLQRVSQTETKEAQHGHSNPN